MCIMACYELYAHDSGCENNYEDELSFELCLFMCQQSHTHICIWINRFLSVSTSEIHEFIVDIFVEPFFLVEILWQSVCERKRDLREWLNLSLSGFLKKIWMWNSFFIFASMNPSMQVLFHYAESLLLATAAISNANLISFFILLE